LLILTGEKEEAKASGFNIMPISEITIADLYPLGRLTLYTKQALDELESQGKLTATFNNTEDVSPLPTSPNKSPKTKK
jgi:hypothetical protein